MRSKYIFALLLGAAAGCAAGAYLWRLSEKLREADRQLFFVISELVQELVTDDEVRVQINRGRVYLLGPIPVHQLSLLLTKVISIPGVRSVRHVASVPARELPAAGRAASTTI